MSEAFARALGAGLGVILAVGSYYILMQLVFWWFRRRRATTQTTGVEMSEEKYKLYRVEMMIETVVAAKSSLGANEEILLMLGDLETDATPWNAKEIKKMSDLPDGWEPEALPWGSPPEEKTVKEWLGDCDEP